MWHLSLSSSRQMKDWASTRLLSHSTGSLPVMSSILILMALPDLHWQPDPPTVWPDCIHAVVERQLSWSRLGPSSHRHSGQGRGGVVEAVGAAWWLDWPSGPRLGATSSRGRILVTLAPGAERQRQVSIYGCCGGTRGVGPWLVNVVMKVLLGLQS